MNLKAVAETARQHICDLFAADMPCDIRLETWLYDDHLMVWSLTLGFTRAGDPRPQACPCLGGRQIRSLRPRRLALVNSRWVPRRDTALNISAVLGSEGRVSP